MLEGRAHSAKAREYGLAAYFLATRNRRLANRPGAPPTGGGGLRPLTRSALGPRYAWSGSPPRLRRRHRAVNPPARRLSSRPGRDVHDLTGERGASSSSVPPRAPCCGSKAPEGRRDWPSPTPRGALVISLDFELHWGVRDKLSVRTIARTWSSTARLPPCSSSSPSRRHATWPRRLPLLREQRELVEALPAPAARLLHNELSP